MVRTLLQLIRTLRGTSEAPCFHCGCTTDTTGLLCGDSRCDAIAAEAQAMLAADLPAFPPKAQKLRYTQSRASAGAWQLL